MRIHACAVTVFGVLIAACSAPRSNATGPANPPKPTPQSATTEPQPDPAEPPARAAAVEAPQQAVALRTFEPDSVDAPPPGFSFGRTGEGRPGRWVAHIDGDARVLAQLDDDATDDRFPVAVLDEPILRDVIVHARCKLISGRVDQACGLVARYRDENNYFITRANALENNVRLYTVSDGTRRQIASWKGRIVPKTWHEYRFELRGDHLQVFWNGERVLDHHDTTFSEAGRAGLWTKADSITYFDDLRVEPAS